MRASEIVTEWGKVVKGVNTTPDVQPGEIQRQAAKFGFVTDENGLPPVWTGAPSKTGTKDTPNKATKGQTFYGKDGRPPNHKAPIVENLTEAPVSDEMRAKVYYHGSGGTGTAKKIMKDGLKGVEVQAKGQMSPVAGRVYVTTDLRYAIIYALGGDYLGSDPSASKIEGDPYGYVFVIDGSALDDVQPDEDSVGEFVYKYWRPDIGRFERTDQAKQVWNFLKHAMTPRQFQASMDGTYAAWAAGGKKALKTMPDWMKHWLITHGAHVAATGKLMPSQVWRIDRRKSKLLKKDGSNFFEIAKKIK